MLKGVHVHRGFISRPMCRKLIDIYDRNTHAADKVDYSGFPIIHISRFAGQDRVDLARVTRTVARRVRRWYGETIIESSFLSRLGEGGCHHSHADNCQFTGYRWEPNHTPQRSFSSLIYLSTWAKDFAGGELEFLSMEGEVLKKVRPSAGMLVAFPSGKDHFHHVREVTRGSRYSMPVWFTQDPEHACRVFEEFATV